MEAQRVRSASVLRVKFFRAGWSRPEVRKESTAPATQGVKEAQKVPATSSRQAVSTTSTQLAGVSGAGAKEVTLSSPAACGRLLLRLLWPLRMLAYGIYDLLAFLVMVFGFALLMLLITFFGLFETRRGLTHAPHIRPKK